LEVEGLKTSKEENGYTEKW